MAHSSTSSDPVSLETIAHPSVVSQLEWTLGCLNLGRVVSPPGTVCLEPIMDPTGRDPAPGDALAPDHLETQFAADDASLIQWLTTARQVQSRRGAGVWEAEPEGEPRTIREIAAALLSPYVVRDGRVGLAGCMLEVRPSLRIGSVHQVNSSLDVARLPSEIRYRYFGPDGSRLTTEEAEARGLRRVQRAAQRLRPGDRESIENWIAVSEAIDEVTDHGESDRRIVDATVVWSRWASGKIVLQFDNGESRLVPFEGWASDFAAGRAVPPPYECAISGHRGYEVIALDDGTVVAASAVGRCELSGRELLADDLAVCEITGRRADRQLMRVCGSTGRLVLADQMAECQWCGSRVVPGALEQGVCDRCRARKPLAVHDPVVRRLIDTNRSAVQRLGRRGRWTGWTSATKAVVVGGGLWRQRLVVFDMDRGKVIRSGWRGRLSSRWIVDDSAD